MRTPVRHISYGILHYPIHTLMSRMYGTITTLVPLYLVFQHFPVDLNRLSSRWSSSIHGTSVNTHFFDSKHIDVKKMIGDSNGHLELTLLKVRQRFDANSTANLEVYKFRGWWILTYPIFGLGESSFNIWSTVNLERTFILLFYYFLCLKVNLDLEKHKSVWWIFTQLYFCGGEPWPNYVGKEVNWWWILTYRFCWKREQRWRVEVGRFKMSFDTCMNEIWSPESSKQGPSRKYDIRTIIIQPLHARACMPTSYARGGLLCKHTECMVYMGSNSNFNSLIV